MSSEPTRRLDEQEAAAPRAAGSPARLPRRGPDAAAAWGAPRWGSHAGHPATSVARWQPPRLDWFADEIAIDFPSVGAVVDRMRDAFLAPEDQPRALTREISLSPLDAFTGRVVPLAVPVRCLCEACGGRGETWTEPCMPCGGSGEALFTRTLQISVPPRIVDGACIRLQVSTPHALPTRVNVRVTINQ